MEDPSHFLAFDAFHQNKIEVFLPVKKICLCCVTDDEIVGTIFFCQMHKKVFPMRTFPNFLSGGGGPLREPLFVVRLC